MHPNEKTDLRLAAFLLTGVTAVGLLVGCGGNVERTKQPGSQAAPALKGEQAAAQSVAVQSDLMQASQIAQRLLAETGTAPESLQVLTNEGFRPSTGTVTTYVAVGNDWCISAYNPRASAANTATSTLRSTAGGTLQPGTPGTGACAGRS